MHLPHSAATTGQPPLADQVNQFLVTHPTTYVYTGVEQNHLATAGTGTTASDGLWIAQQFTASSVFTTGRVVLTLAVTGSPGPLSVSVCADNAGVPSSTVLAGPVSIPAQFVPGTAGTVSVPLPGLTVASGTSYWVVAQPAGDASDFYAWSQANGASGAATSPDGVTWTLQAYNLLFQVWDDTAVLPLVHTWEDAGARWTGMTTNAQGQPTSLAEFTAGQTAAGYAASSATLGYSGNALTGVAASGAPAWSAPHNGILGDASGTAGAGQVNQFLTTHGITAVYQGNSVLTPNGSSGDGWAYPLAAQDIDQPFTMSGTAIGRVQVPLLAVGQGADLLVSLCTDNAGNPGTVLTQTRIPANWTTQLAAATGYGQASGGTVGMQLTGNPLATAQFNALHSGTPSTGLWTAPAALAGSNLTTPASASYGGTIILVGGTDSGATTTFSGVYSVSCAGGTIAPAVPQPSYPTTVFAPTVIVVPEADGTTLTVVSTGGFTSASSGTCNANAFTAGFNASTGVLSAWSAQASLPVALDGHSAATANGYVYVLGGQGTSSAYVSSVYYAEVQNGQITGWTAATPLPVPLGDMFTAVANGFLYVLGGGNISLSNYAGWYAPINADGSLGQWVPTTVSPYFIATSLQPAPTAGDFGVVLVRNEFVTTLATSAYGPALDWSNDEISPSVPTTFASALEPVGDGQWRLYQLAETYYVSDLTLTPCVSVPLPATGLTNGATYHVLLQQQGGDLNDYLVLWDSVDAVGSAAVRSSARGAYAWSPGTAGHQVPVQVYDQTVPTRAGELPLHAWSDNGAQVTSIVSATTPDQRPLGVLEATVQSYALNANQGFETGTDPWFASGGTLAQSTAQVFEGAYAAQVTPSGVDANVYLGSENMPCMPGQPVTVDGWIWCTAAVTGNVSLSVNWYTLAGTYISTSSNDVSVAAATWTELANTFTAPTGAYQFAIAATVSGTPAASQVFYVDQVRAYYTYTGPQTSTVTQIEYAGTYPWPWPGTGTVQLA